MNELIKIGTDRTGQPAVSGRELHQFLEIKTPYSMWFDRMCEYGFEECVDYTAYKIVRSADLQGSRDTFDHAVSIDMAKEVSHTQATCPHVYGVALSFRYCAASCG